MEPAGEVERLGGEVEMGLNSIWMRCELSQLGSPPRWVSEWEMGERREVKGWQGLGEEVLPQMVPESAVPLVELSLEKRVLPWRLKVLAWRLLLFAERAGAVEG